MPEGLGVAHDYFELVQIIVGTLHRGDLETHVPTWINETELELFRDCRVRPGEHILSGTFVGGEPSIMLPYGFQEATMLELRQGTQRWSPMVVSLDQLGRYMTEDDGMVRAISTFGQEIHLAPPPIAGMTYRLFYRGLPAPLSRTNPTTRLFEMGWDAYLYGALMLSAPFIGDDERLATWGPLYAKKKESLRITVWRARAGGGLLTQRPDFMVQDRHTEESAI